MSKKDRFYLACPYEEKDEAKALGARWDNDVRKWYVPDEVDTNLFTKWFTEGEADQADPFFG